MDDETPPKRVTRARAAAKTKPEPEVNIATAASKVKATRSNAASSSRRKVQVDEPVGEATESKESEETVDQLPPKPKTTRGRPKKAVKAEVEAETAVEEDTPVIEAEPAPAPAKVTRGRGRSKPAVVEDDPMAEAAPAVARSTRGRAKSVVEEEAPALEISSPPAKATRGRAKSVVEEETPATTTAPVPAKATRGRPRKGVVETQSSESATMPVKPIRGRPKKAEHEGNTIEVVTEAARKLTRGRTAPTTIPANVPKKSVKFEEPHNQNKENIVPSAGAKGKAKEAVAETGLKAKPVRKPAVTRATRGRPKVTETDKSPLSPKKATQVAKSDNVSEDELAVMEKTPMKPLMKSPLKAPGSMFGTAKKLDFSTSIIANRAMVPSTQDLGTSLMGSPARRPPQSPFKDAMKTSPRRGPALGESILKSPMRSPFKTSMGPPAHTESHFKASLLQSPARRPQSPTKVSVMGSPSRTGSNAVATPKPAPFSISKFTATPRTLTKSAYGASKSLFNSSIKIKDAQQDAVVTAESQLIKPFSGRLSAVMPRHADVDLQENSLPESIPENNETNTTVVVKESCAHPLAEDPMVVDQPEIVVEETIIVGNIESTTPPQSPPRNSIGSFSLRQDEDPFQDSDSEDELASDSPRFSPAPLSSFNISSKDFATFSTPHAFVPISKTPRTAAIGHTLDVGSEAATKSIKSKRDQIGYTPLAKQLSSWMAASPESDKTTSDGEEQTSPTARSFQQDQHRDIASAVEASPSKSTFFDDAMSIHEEVQSTEPEPVEDTVDAIDFAPTTLDDEDIALAAEADEMSLLEIPPTQDEFDFFAVDGTENEHPATRELDNPSTAQNVAEADFVTYAARDDELFTAVNFDNENPTDAIAVAEEDFNDAVDILNSSTSSQALSEASQEYGDENATAIDPNLLALDVQIPNIISTPDPAAAVATPIRFSAESNVIHTVSKVPLKPAAIDTPSRPSFDFSKKRPASVSRIAAQRAAPPRPAPATVYTSRTQSANSHATPTKSTSWSTAATPTQTPRRTLDDQVLKGAVVYVDVHTTEGADASAVFVELLGQMGARCVKTWSWNPNSASSSPESSQGSSDDSGAKDSKVGITHVVFKDGGKRTIEKVRETQGVVCCVGVGWVLDCERTQSWLDEAPYSIDTSLVPRGGHRRRKSMEPRQLQNLNGNLTPRARPAATPRSVSASNISATPSREPILISNTPGTLGTVKMDRRKSTIWERSPDSDSDGSNGDMDRLMLSPVPATPAAEFISQYAEHVLDGDVGEATPYFLRQEDLVMQTAPANRVAGREEGASGVLSEISVSDAGGGVLMQRLLLARRKSLQFAPKVGSPLARGASYGA